MVKILSSAMKGNPEDPKEKMVGNTFSLRPIDIENLERIMLEYGISNKSLMLRQLIAEKVEEGKQRMKSEDDAMYRDYVEMKGKEGD